MNHVTTGGNYVAHSLKSKLKKLYRDDKISEREYEELIKKLDGHDKEIIRQVKHAILEENIIKLPEPEACIEPVIQCDTCGLYYQPSRGHQCNIYEGPMILNSEEIKDADK